MGKRARQQKRLKAPTSDYSDGEGNVLTLRGSLTVGARREYEQALAASPLSQEDAWQRGLELLFELLARRWTIADAPIEGPRELLARYRAASANERRWVRETLRRHCAENFPGVEVP